MGVLDQTAGIDVVADGAPWTAPVPSLLTAGATGQQQCDTLTAKTLA